MSELAVLNAFKSKPLDWHLQHTLVGNMKKLRQCVMSRCLVIFLHEYFTNIIGITV